MLTHRPTLTRARWCPCTFCPCWGTSSSSVYSNRLLQWNKRPKLQFNGLHPLISIFKRAGTKWRVFHLRPQYYSASCGRWFPEGFQLALHSTIKLKKWKAIAQTVWVFFWRWRRRQSSRMDWGWGLWLQRCVLIMPWWFRNLISVGKNAAGCWMSSFTCQCRFAKRPHLPREQVTGNIKHVLTSDWCQACHVEEQQLWLVGADRS